MADMNCNDLCFLKSKHPNNRKIADEVHDSGCSCGEEEE
jgi:hypothetical protein